LVKARVAASVVLAVGVVMGTAGCNLIAPQGTEQIRQATSFGIEGDVGQIHIRNAYLVAQGSQVRLVATFVNKGDSKQTLQIQPNASATDTKTLQVGTGAPKVVGPEKYLQWNDFKVPKGSLFPVFFSYGDKPGVTLNLPVLTGDFTINSTLTPTPVPTDTPSDESTPTATPTDTPTAG
jgi:hypothetical protein